MFEKTVDYAEYLTTLQDLRDKAEEVISGLPEDSSTWSPQDFEKYLAVENPIGALMDNPLCKCVGRVTEFSSEGGWVRVCLDLEPKPKNPKVPTKVYINANRREHGSHYSDLLNARVGEMLTVRGILYPPIMSVNPESSGVWFRFKSLDRQRVSNPRKSNEEATGKAFVQGVLAAAFIVVPILWVGNVIPGWLAFAGMFGIAIIGSTNNQ